MSKQRTPTAPVISLQDPYRFSCDLTFNLRRCEEYHRSEATFCRYMTWGSPILVGGLLIIMMGLLNHLGFALTKESWLLICSIGGGSLSAKLGSMLNKQRQVHEHSAAECMAWLAKLERETNPKAILKLHDDFRKSWFEQPQKYVVHYAVDALAFNAVVKRMYEPEAWPLYCLKLGRKERLLAHFFPFSKQHIQSQQRSS